MDLSLLKQRLDLLGEKYRKWREPFDELYKQDMKRGIEWREFHQRHQQMLDEALAIYDPAKDLASLLEELCHAYMTAKPRERTEIRNAVAVRDWMPGRIREFAVRAATEIHSRDDVAWLRKGLLAMSMENGVDDYRDSYVALLDLWLAAERAKFDPQPVFEEIAAISDDRPTVGRGHSFANALREFRRS